MLDGAASGEIDWEERSGQVSCLDVGDLVLQGIGANLRHVFDVFFVSWFQRFAASRLIHTVRLLL